MKKKVKKTFHFLSWPMIAAIFFLVLILLGHSAWMESWLIQKLKSGLLSQGIQSDIKSLKYNLLVGNLDCTGVHLAAPGWKANLNKIKLNGSYEMMFGDLVLDRISIFGGTLEISPDGNLSKEGAGNPVPSFIIHSAHVQDLKLLIGDTEKNLNFELSDILGRYENELFELDAGLVFAFPEEGKSAQLKIRSKTPDFIKFDPFFARLSEDTFSFEVNGSLSLNGPQNLQVLASYSPWNHADPVSLSAVLDSEKLNYNLCFKPHGLPEIEVSGHTTVQMGEPVYLPFHVNSHGFLDLDIQAMITPEWTVSGVLAGDVQIPGAKDHPNSHFYLQSDFSNKGLNQFELLYHINPRDLTVGTLPCSLSGAFDVHPGASPQFESSHLLEVSNSTVLISYAPSSVFPFKAFFDLESPSNLLTFVKDRFPQTDDLVHHYGNKLKGFGASAGSIQWRGMDQDSLVIDELVFKQEVDPSSWVPILDPAQGFAAVRITARGPLKDFKGILTQSEELAANFSLDLRDFKIKKLTADWQNYCLETQVGTVCLRGTAEGSGHLNNPEILASWQAEILTDSPKASVSGLMSLSNGILELTQIQGQSRQVHFSGNGFLDLTEPNWALDLGLDAQRNDRFSPLLSFEMPKFVFKLKGGPQGMEVVFDFQSHDQTPPSSLTIPIDLASLLPYAEVNRNQIEIGGILLDQFDVSVIEDIPQLRGRFSIIDPELVSEVFKNWRFEPLEYEFLDGSFQWDFLPGTCSGLHIGIDHLSGHMYGEELLAENWSLDLGQGLSFLPLHGTFAGAELTLGDSFHYDSNSGIPSSLQDQDLSFNIQFQVKDRDRFNRFGQNYFWDLPQPKSFDFDLGQFELGFEWSRDFWDFQFWAVLPKSQASYLNQEVEIQDGTLYWGNQFLLNAGEIQLNKRLATVKAYPQETHLRVHLDVPDLSKTFSQVSGYGDWIFDARWHYELDRNLWHGVLSQETGRLFYAFPKSEVTYFKLNFEHDTGQFKFDPVSMIYNGGAVKGQGFLSRTGLKNDFRVSADRIGLDFIDYQLTSSMQLAFEGERDQFLLSGDCTVHEGYMFPVMAMSTLVQTLFPEYPQLSLPDPRLQGVSLNIQGKTEAPILIDHPLAYLEVEIPEITLKGTLASPLLEAGEIWIHEGSELNLRNDQFVFKPSQIQFTADHPEDPFFQIALEHMEMGTPKPVQMIGYLSDIMRGDTDTTDIISIMVSYMMGQVSSMLNLETETNENVFDTDFALVLSKSLGRRFTTRYVVPLDIDKAQEFEVGYGPYSGIFFNYARDEYNRVNLSQIKRFGFPGDQSEEHIKKIGVQVEKPLKKDWVKRKWKLKRGDVFSETSLRQAKFFLEKELKANGFLDPEVWVGYQDRIIEIEVDPGPLYSLQPEGLELTRGEQKEILRRLSLEGESTMTAVRSYLENLIIEKGYLPGSVETHIRGTQVMLKFNPGDKIEKYAISFGQGNKILKKMVRNKRWVKQFIRSYLSAPTGTRRVLRNLLAARGYVTPSIGKGTFNSEKDLFLLPVKLGKRAVCGGISCRLDDEVLELDPVVAMKGMPFDYDLVDESVEQIKVFCQKRETLFASFQVNSRYEKGQVYIDIRAFSHKDPKYETIDFSGNEVLDSDAVSHLINLKPHFKKTDLVEAQRRLVKSGQFSFVALNTEQTQASFELKERNRYDLDYGAGWSDETGAGIFLQFKDRMFLHGPHDFVSRLEFNEYEQRHGTQMQFRNLRGLPGDLFLTFENYSVHKARAQFSHASENLYAYSYLTPVQSKAIAEFRIPITRWNRLQFGFEFNHIHEDEWLRWYESTDQVSSGIFVDAVHSTQQNTFAPLKLSWAYENLNNYMLPRSGIMTSAGIEWYDEMLGNDENHRGPRIVGNWTGFFNRDRWLLQQRVKFGAFFPRSKDPFNFAQSDPVLFYLGGGNSLRGFERDSLGPVTPGTYEAKGGKAMLFTSTELTFLTGWYGLGLSPFLDVGQVWSDVSDADLGNMVWTGGLGLVFDTSIGYFRLDYVEHLKDDQPGEIKKEWHFRIGRMF